MERPRDAIISIKPFYAEAIMALRKTVELRRRIPQTPRGTRLWIYATRPVAAIVGTAVVLDVARGAPQDIWNAYSEHAHISKREFQAYFEETDQAVAILLGHISRVPSIGIVQLRELLSGFHPPQVLIKISDDDVSSLERWNAA